MPAYERFAPFYDEVMDDPGPRADRVRHWIDRYRPGATSLLELGCGTGSLLARLPSVPSLTGLDRSPGMLAAARQKVPGARLVEGDMRSFSLDRRFDVVACVFDSLNHLLSFDDWRSAFDAVHDHLVDGGLFVFDVNTVGELRRLGEDPPAVVDFEGGTAVIDVSFAEEAALSGEAVFAEEAALSGDAGGLGDPGAGVGTPQAVSSWDIRIFEHVGGDRYELHHEQIGELAVPLAWLRSALEERFALLEAVDGEGEGGPPTDGSVKGHFAYRRVP